MLRVQRTGNGEIRRKKGKGDIVGKGKMGRQEEKDCKR